MARGNGLQDLYAQVNAKRLMADVEAIARWVRLSGTPEEMQSFRYVQRQLRAAGCKTHLILHDAYISLPGPASLRVTPAGGETSLLACITHSFAASTSPDGLEAPVVYAGGGTAADLAAARASGRIAILDGLATPDRVHGGQVAGAVGLVFLNRDPLVHEMIVSTVWGSPTLDSVGRLPRLPVVSVAREAGNRLREVVKAGGARLRITAEVDTRWRQTPILIADLPGASDDTFVMMAGHLDSWHRGAMDNGTANATMLEVARVMAKVKRYRGVRFAFWSGHSHGRYSGSTWYADHHWDELNARCVAHVNIDSVGARGAEINRHAFAMPETRGVADRVIAGLVHQRFEGGRVGRMGDQSFLGVGVPSLLMSVSEQPAGGPDASTDFNLRTGGATGGLGWWWHTTDDTPDKIDPQRLVRDCRIYLGIIHAFSTSPVLPLDYAATARDWTQKLTAVTRAAGRHVNVGPTIAAARRLGGGAQALARAAQTVSKSANRQAVRVINQALMELGRALIPIGYTQTGRFDHDPAMEQRDVPLLAAARALADAEPDHARHLAVRAVRDLNAVRYALARAADLAQAAVLEVRGARQSVSDRARRAVRRRAG